MRDFGDWCNWSDARDMVDEAYNKGLSKAREYFAWKMSQQQGPISSLDAQRIILEG